MNKHDTQSFYPECFDLYDPNLTAIRDCINCPHLNECKDLTVAYNRRSDTLKHILRDTLQLTLYTLAAIGLLLLIFGGR